MSSLFMKCRSHILLSSYKNMKEARKVVMENIKKCIEANPLLQGKLSFPPLSTTLQAFYMEAMASRGRAPATCRRDFKDWKYQWELDFIGDILLLLNIKTVLHDLSINLCFVSNFNEVKIKSTLRCLVMHYFMEWNKSLLRVKSALKLLSHILCGSMLMSNQLRNLFFDV